MIEKPFQPPIESDKSQADDSQPEQIDISQTPSTLRDKVGKGLVSDLPNLKWLALGAVTTIGFLVYYFTDTRRESPLETISFLLPGFPVAFAFLLFNNPKEQKNGLHLVISFVMIIPFWPLFLLLLLAIRPWNSKAWKQRPRKVVVD